MEPGSLVLLCAKFADGKATSERQENGVGYLRLVETGERESLNER
jgi:hypothetical protein